MLLDCDILSASTTNLDLVPGSPDGDTHQQYEGLHPPENYRG